MKSLLLRLSFACWTVALPLAAQTGSLTGRIRHADTREGLPAVNVRVSGTTFGAATDDLGAYEIKNVPAGTYKILATGIGHRSVEAEITLFPGENIQHDFWMIDEAVKANEVMVYGASLRRERITDAPSAVSLLDARQIMRNSAGGQIPKLLESEPGVDIAQSGLFDYNLNTRGFNSSLNRRVLVLLDGRDLGTAFLGATEWNGLSMPLEDMGRVELVRGPGSALYGANAYNGVLNITSQTPRSTVGTKVILGAGELEMYRADVRHAGVSGPWSFRVNMGTINGKSFSRNRAKRPVTDFEYDGFTPGLNNEEVALNAGPVSSTYGSARVDYEFDDGVAASIEGGSTLVKNEVIVTGIGRVQALEATRPWARMHYQGNGLSVNLWTNGRFNAKPDLSLSTGLSLYQDAQISQGEAQYGFSVMDNDVFIVVGASQRLVSIDTKGSLMKEARNDNMTGVFGQFEYKVTEVLKAVLAARWDRSTLISSQFSPKAAIVWSPDVNHTLRATFNQAFQSPNYSELYLNVKHPLRSVVYYGNPRLDPEHITGYELGYKGVFSKSLFVTADTYFNILEDFVTDLGPGINPAYLGPIIVAPDTFSRQVWSYTNAGEVHEAGYELGVNYYLSDEWLIDANFTYFTFEVVSRHPNDVLLPNAPRYKVNGGISYTSPDGYDFGVKIKHIPGFPWAAGIYRGDILAYTIVSISAAYEVSQNLMLSMNMSNALDNRHYEIFGGSILGRRGIVTASYTF